MERDKLIKCKKVCQELSYITQYTKPCNYTYV